MPGQERRVWTPRTPKAIIAIASLLREIIFDFMTSAMHRRVMESREGVPVEGQRSSWIAIRESGWSMPTRKSTRKINASRRFRPRRRAKSSWEDIVWGEDREIVWLGLSLSYLHGMHGGLKLDKMSVVKQV